MQLFECQTCENCYHANCMKPGLDPTNVPTFWFCPHCVEKEFNIPTTSPDTMSIMPTPPSNSTPEASSTRIIAELTETSSG